MIIIIKAFTGWSLTIPFIFLMIGQIFNDYFQGYMRGIKKLNTYSICMGFTTLMIVLCTILMLRVFNLGLSGILYGYALGYILGDILIIIVTKFWKYLDLKLASFKTIKQMVKYSLPLIFNDISWWIVNASDRSVINMFLGTTMNGIYAIANKVPSLCSSVFGVFSISWQETATESQNDTDRNIYFNDVFNKTIAILISLCTGILSANFILFDFVFDAKYELARFHSPILVFSIIFLSISQFLGGIQISFKQPKENGITTVIAAIVNIIVNLSLIKFIGLYAASISTLVSNIVLVILRKIRLSKKVTLKVDSKNIFYFLIFIYMFVCQYFKLPIYISLINVCIAGILFIYINREFVKKIAKKVGLAK